MVLEREICYVDEPSDEELHYDVFRWGVIIGEQQGLEVGCMRRGLVIEIGGANCELKFSQRRN